MDDNVVNPIKTAMKERFTHQNLAKWIKGFSHKEKAELAVYSAELVIDSHHGENNSPVSAIIATKSWINDHPEGALLNSCPLAHAASYASELAFEIGSDVAECAAYAACVAACSPEKSSDYCVKCVMSAHYADSNDSIKESIVNWIYKKQTEKNGSTSLK